MPRGPQGGCPRVSDVTAGAGSGPGSISPISQLSNAGIIPSLAARINSLMCLKCPDSGVIHGWKGRGEHHNYPRRISMGREVSG